MVKAFDYTNSAHVRIKSDPAYLEDSSYWTRAWVTTNWKKWAR
jgi:hypothetical protein